jgi:hypothetical protein
VRKSTLGVLREGGPNPQPMAQVDSLQFDAGELVPEQILRPYAGYCSSSRSFSATCRAIPTCFGFALGV